MRFVLPLLFLMEVGADSNSSIRFKPKSLAQFNLTGVKRSLLLRFEILITINYIFVSYSNSSQD